MNESYEKWYERFDDEEFINYIESGEAACVHIVRDKAQNVNTDDKWIDVISYTRGFSQIDVELFQRITHPQYTNDTEKNRFICWNAAHDDIAEHRSKGHHGSKYTLQCKRVKVKDENGRTHWDYKVVGVKKIK